MKSELELQWYDFSKSGRQSSPKSSSPESKWMTIENSQPSKHFEIAHDKAHTQASTSLDYVNFWKATYCSISMMISCIATNAILNCHSKAMENVGYEKLGFFSLALMNLTCGFASLFSSFLLEKIGIKVCLILGCFFDFTWIVLGQLPFIRDDNPNTTNFFLSTFFIYLSQMFVSGLDGFGGAMSQVAQSAYISDCATKRTRGFYFGYFWIFQMSSHVVGSYLASKIVEYQGQDELYSSMGVLCLVGAAMFSFVRQPTGVEEQDGEQKENDMGRELVSITSASSHHGMLDHVPHERLEHAHAEIKNNPIDEAGQVLRLLCFNKKMRWLLPQIIWSGITIAFYSGLMIPLISDTIVTKDLDHQLEMSMQAMLYFGIGEMFGGIFIGLILDRYGNYVSSLVIVLMVLAQTMLTLTFFDGDKFNWKAFLMPFLWGLQDSASNTFLLSILGFEFSNNVEPYSAYFFTQSMAIIAFEVTEAFLQTDRQMRAYIVLVGIVGLLSCLCTTIYYSDFVQTATQESRDNHTQYEQEMEVASDEDAVSLLSEEEHYNMPAL